MDQKKEINVFMETKRLGEIHHHLNRFAAIDGVFFLNVDKKNIKNNLKNMI